jgi:hypothetical protein
MEVDTCSRVIELKGATGDRRQNEMTPSHMLSSTLVPTSLLLPYRRPCLSSTGKAESIYEPISHPSDSMLTIQFHL